jgi:putative copper export protein
VDLVSVLLRWLEFVALFQTIGAGLFLLLFRQTLRETAVRIRFLILGSALTVAVLATGHYALEAGRLSGTWEGIADPDMQSLVWDSPAGTVWIERVLAAVLLSLSSRAGHALSISAATAGVVLVAMSFMALGHTALLSAPPWLPLLLVMHVSIAGFWFGGLVPLMWVACQEQAALAAVVVEQFSRRAIWLVPGLFVAGILMAWSLVPSWSALARPYGMLLLGKLVGFAILMVFALMNLRRYGPALAKDLRVVQSFRRSVASEFAIIVLALFVTAVLTTFYSPES